MVPQKPVWQETTDLVATQERVDNELASFLTGNQALDVYETLRLLNGLDLNIWGGNYNGFLP